MIKRSLLLTFLCLSSAVHAGDFSQTGTITLTYTYGDWTMVKMTGTPVNPDSCSSTEYYAIPSADKNYDAIFSSILAAQIAKKNVRFWIGGCDGQYGYYPKIVSIQVITD